MTHGSACGLGIVVFMLTVGVLIHSRWLSPVVTPIRDKLRLIATHVQLVLGIDCCWYQLPGHDLAPVGGCRQCTMPQGKAEAGA
jgi:hypothetical protein